MRNLWTSVTLLLLILLVGSVYDAHNGHPFSWIPAMGNAGGMAFFGWKAIRTPRTE